MLWAKPLDRTTKRLVVDDVFHDWTAGATPRAIGARFEPSMMVYRMHPIDVSLQFPAQRAGQPALEGVGERTVIP